MPLNWADLVADWIDNRTVDYTIKYWKENLDDSWYTEIVSDEKEIDMSNQVFARGFDSLSEKDKQEIINLIKFKNNYKE